jgi:hypothetical protein
MRILPFFLLMTLYCSISLIYNVSSEQKMPEYFINKLEEEWKNKNPRKTDCFECASQANRKFC